MEQRRPELEMPGRVAHRPRDPMPDAPVCRWCGAPRTSPTRCLDEFGGSASRRRAVEGDARVYADPAEHGFARVRRGPRWRSRARWSGGCSDDDDDLVAQGPPPRRGVRRLQPERATTIAAAYSARGTPEGRVSMPLRWGRDRHGRAGDFTIATMPAFLPSSRDPGRHRRPRCPDITPCRGADRDEAAGDEEPPDDPTVG